MTDSIFAEDFAVEPWWWGGFRPPAEETVPLPGKVGTLVIGAGYAGTACALRLAEANGDVFVVDAEAIGHGASSRSGGQASGGVNVGKSPTRAPVPKERKAGLLRDASAGFSLFESLLERHQIRCGFHKTGRINGIWTPQHAESWRTRLDELNTYAQSDARLLDKEEAAAELGSRFYHGGVSIMRAGHVQPAEYFGGLLDAAKRAGARFAGHAAVHQVQRVPGGFRAETARGVIAADRAVFTTNAYTNVYARGLAPDLRRGLVPVMTHMIATEKLAPDLAASILPTNRCVSETRRVIAHYRKSPDGTRLLYGGRATFFPLEPRKSAKLLYDAMLARFPQLRGTKITHTWGGRVAMTIDHLPHIGGADGRYFAAGCQGSGVVMMTYLGTSLAEKILSGEKSPINAYDDGLPPTHPLYDGTPWFMPVLGTWFQLQDRWDRKAA